MNAADLTKLSALMAMARRAAEAQLRVERAAAARLNTRITELRADLTQPMVPDPPDGHTADPGDIGAQIAWRRGLEAKLRRTAAEFAEREAAVQARRAELTQAFGREQATTSLATNAKVHEQRESQRRAEAHTTPSIRKRPPA